MKNIKYCCGCGLCNNFKKGNIDEKGYFRPNKELKTEEFNYDVCYHNYLKRADLSKMWGNIDSIFYGYSENELIRTKGSSGGILTEIACYLLENNIVDYVIQIKASLNNPLTTEVVYNKDSKEVIEAIGSKYTASAVLIDIIKKIDLSKKYAIIGKPCDIRVIREYMNLYKKYQSNIIYLFTFFCAGTPSKDANKNLINYLNVKEKEIDKFVYRGNGWPGKTVAIKKDGTQVETDYETSWSQYLGRDIQKICRFCWEGVGEAADISCGDGWYLENNEPSFKENEGRNIILSRTPKGTELLNKMQQEKKIKLEDVEDIDVLEKMQPNHFMRKSSMFATILAMRVMFKKAPKYNLKQLYKYSKNLSLNKNLRYFLGTIKRIKKL